MSLEFAALRDCDLIESLLNFEARLLDEGRFDEWINLFAEDGYYWVPAAPNCTSPYDAVSLFYDDREMMRTRVNRLKHPKAHAQNPRSRTCHYITNLNIETDEAVAGEFLVRSNVLMLEYRLEKQTIYGGTCRHLLKRKADGNFEISWKRVDLVNCDGVFELLSVPF